MTAIVEGPSLKHAAATEQGISLKQGIVNI
jgi:hypothetical protein